MKKIFFIVIVLLLTLVAFAEGSIVSIGIGGTFTYDWYFLDAENSGDTFKTETKLPTLGFNVYADFTYVLLDINACSNLDGDSKAELNGTKIASTDIESRLGFLGVQLLGKYPIDLGSFQIFPLLGMEYKRVLLAEDKDGNSYLNTLEDYHLNTFYLKIGFGADFMVSESFYIRPVALLGYQIYSEDEKQDVKDTFISGTDVSLNHLSLSATLYAGFKL